MFALCFCYDRNYITGKAPYGIHIISSSIKYEDINTKFLDELKLRQKSSNIEFGWDKEYRLCILEISEQNKIKDLKLVDNNDGFWQEQIKNNRIV